MPSGIPLLGAHLSIAGGLENAIIAAEKLHCNVVQLFTKNARTWQETMPDAATVKTFLHKREKAQIACILSHASYLINIASTDKKKLSKSIGSLKSELVRSAALGIDYVVLHPGAYLTAGESQGINRAATTLKQVLCDTGAHYPRLLIETTAGQGTNLGYRFEQISEILEQTGYQKKTGVCMDTSHMFAAGYDITDKKTYDQTMDNFGDTIGFHRLFAIHLNDSKAGLSSRKDRHEHIGMGLIGHQAFDMIMNDARFNRIPKILETPKLLNGTPMDPVNLQTLLGFVT